MRTYSTIISLLLLVACANATKSVSYSDIVYSLMELNDSNDNAQSLENLKKINLSFSESKEQLTKFDERLKNRCSSTQVMGNNKLQAQGKQINALEQAKKENLEKQETLRKTAEEAKRIIASNNEEIRAFNKKIAEERAAYSQSQKARAERYMIFRRLLNFVEDELTSSVAQRKTVMGNINVDKSFSSKTSFIQFERIRSDLAEISAKTADPMSKSMITTLLMLTQSTNKNLFVDQELVTKVKGLINTLMSKELSSDKAEKEALDKNVASYDAIIQTKAEEVDRKKDGELLNVAELASLEHTVRSLDNEIKSYTRAQEKQRRKNATHEQMCQKQADLIKLHLKDFASLESQFKDLQTNLS